MGLVEYLGISDRNFFFESREYVNFFWIIGNVFITGFAFKNMQVAKTIKLPYLD